MMSYDRRSRKADEIWDSEMLKFKIWVGKRRFTLVNVWAATSSQDARPPRVLLCRWPVPRSLNAIGWVPAKPPRLRDFGDCDVTTFRLYRAESAPLFQTVSIRKLVGLKSRTNDVTDERSELPGVLGLRDALFGFLVIPIPFCFPGILTSFYPNS